MTSTPSPGVASRAPSAQVDPWAPGGLMSEPSDHVGPSHGMTAQSSAASPEPPPRNGRRRRIAIALVAAAVVGAGAVVVTSRDDAADGAETSVPTARRGAFPGESISPNTEPSIVTPDLAADEPGITPIGIEFIEVPTALRSIQPTEVVALSPDRGLVEISLPSGRARTTDMRFFTGQAQLSTTDFGSLVVPVGGRANESQMYNLVPRGQQPLPVIGATTVGNVTSTPGRDGFVVWPDLDDRDAVVTSIVANGTITTVDWAQGGSRPAMDPDGRLLDQGTGGIFQTDPDGSRRLSTGDLVTTGRNHVLVHECSDERSCFLVTLTTTGRRVFGAETTNLAPDHPFWSAIPNGLSPDGSAFLAVSDNEARELAVVNVADGSVQPIYSSSTFEVDGAWAADSSGVFFADGDLQFWSQLDTTVITLAGEMPTLRAVTTRTPAASPICEFVDVIVDRFAGMRSGDDIGAPSDRALDGLRTFAPDSLFADTDALITFVDSFVSAERAGSEHIENWPANVRAGVAAIEAFDETDC